MFNFRGLFGRKKEDDKKTEIFEPVLSVTIEEARRLADEKIRDPDILQRCKSISSDVLKEWRGLREALVRLRASDIIEPRAAASKVIKDGFADRAIARIDHALDGRGTDFATLDEAEMFAKAILSALEGIHTGPRETAHIRFFYEEQMADIVARIGRVLNGVNGLRALVQPVIEKRDAVLRLLNDIKGAKYAAQSKKEEAERSSKYAADTREGLSRLAFHDLSELSVLRQELADVESGVSRVDGDIDSRIGPIARLLKRAEHDEGNKNKARTISEYILSPHKALLWDENLVLKDILAGIVSKSGHLRESEPRLLDRAGDLLENFGELETLRSERMALASEAERLRIAVRAEGEKELQNLASQKHTEDMKSEIDRAESDAERLLEEAKVAEERIPGLARQASEALSGLLGKKIEIVAG